ncbi:MAG: hypothetical protein LC772_07615 [Chloroflexi bacterium]|nr:hypothetical protein [Chloroflexota bacterium]
MKRLIGMLSAEYLAACILIPAVWGLIASWAYDWIASRRARRNPPSETPVEDNAPMYYI